MDLNNIERNQLDYFLTDVLPTELSDRFTYIYFYKYLISKNKDIQSMIRHKSRQRMTIILIFCLVEVRVGVLCH